MRSKFKDPRGRFLMSIEIRLSGFLFLFIIITNMLSNLFGYKTFGDWDTDATLQTISNDPKKFKIGFIFILVEHFSIAFLAITLFIAFSPYNLILGIIWTSSRIGEAVLQIINKGSYWGLLRLAHQYADTSGAEKNAVINSVNTILETKDSIFKFAQILFSIGTFSYSILFVTYGVVPPFIGWFGLIASIIYGIANGIALIKPDFKALGYLGGLLILLFEIILGGWLLIFNL